MGQATSQGTDRGALVDLAIDSWRFSRVFLRMMAKLDAGEKARFDSQLRWYLKRVDDALGAAGLRIANIEDQAFDPGIAATALNAADFGPNDDLVVDQMVEPIVLGPDGVVRTGTVLLRKVAR